MARKLKVYRTAIGFHDAYVAAASQKEALGAWGAKADLFARGVAEQVDDPELAREPLAKPGEVVRRSRGTAAEQLAALPPDPPRAKAKPREAEPAAKPPTKREPPPRPSRAALDEAEAELTAAEARHEAALADIARREAELARERKALEKAQADERERLEDERDRAHSRYDRAMARWRG
ncbi:hypothetical protein [Sphingomonas sp.]|uniref:hypothetical protein n=1 Tax=Sphingomonas sp. TaxID=28214 RepID=UPI003B00A902